jgi:cell fate regulator YaaT (PSP1 superfamily)
MNFALVQITPWEKTKKVKYDQNGLRLGDKVIISNIDSHEIGIIIGFDDSEQNNFQSIANKSGDNNQPEEEDFEIVRKANKEDLARIPDTAIGKEIFKDCQAQIKEHKLPMKLVDMNFSFDGSRITFAFIADGRVDFRNLVKDLSKKFGKSIRLHQVGIRDEAKISGDFGHCGRELCCKSFLADLASITSEMAEIQQCVHRGSDRISGACGRLMCCLAYEESGYKALAAKMPPIGAKVSVDGKKGVVISHHTLKQTVNVQFDGEKDGGKVILEIDLNRNKK